MKIFLLFLTTLYSVSFIQAQTQGLVVQTGLTAAYSKDKIVTHPGEGHYGWMIGADARLMEGNLYFVIGGQYHQSSLASTSNAAFFSNDWKMIMGRGGLGFNILNVSDKIALRSKVLGSLNFIMDSPTDGLNIEGYKDINDSFLGVVSGLGITLGSLDIDLEYQYGFINAYRLQPNTTFNIWTFMAGFHF
ncbi:MAG: hypothetical protein IPL55_03950 [Saprospiraceae bacterium]|jgi:hypothetical protein|nr:hypothetical protein [Saprospiraceae bacterium]